MSGGKIVTDLGESHLFTVRKKVFSFAKETYHAPEVEGKDFFVLQEEFSGKEEVQMDMTTFAHPATVFESQDVGIL
jgi:hypothetical protein